MIRAKPLRRLSKVLRSDRQSFGSVPDAGVGSASLVNRYCSVGYRSTCATHSKGWACYSSVRVTLASGAIRAAGRGMAAAGTAMSFALFGRGVTSSAHR
jgi:hypothetical protein